MTNSNHYKERVLNLQRDYGTAETMLKTEQKKCSEAQDEHLDAVDAQHVIQAIAKGIQESAHKQIAGVVSRCLEAVFDEPYKFKMNFELKRGRTEVALVFERLGMEVDPMDASGGGVVDVAAFALRCACLVLSRPKLRRILVMDEPFKFVSEIYRPRVREMIDALSVDLNIQFVIVTHISELETGKVVRL